MNKLINYSKIIEGLKIEDDDALIYYLREIYTRLSRKDIEKVTPYKFSKYMNLSTFIGNKVFSNLNKNDLKGLNGDKFIKGIQELYNIEYYSITKFYFDMLDYTKIGVIYQQDVRIFLYHMKPQDDIFHLEEAISNILKDTFGEKDHLTYSEFLYVIENICSDLLFILLLYFYEKQPFTNNLIRYCHSFENTNTVMMAQQSISKVTTKKKVSLGLERIKQESKKDVITLKKESTSSVNQPDLNTDKYILISTPTRNIIVFSSELTYSKLIKNTLKRNITIEDENNISNEFNSLIYQKSIPNSLCFDILSRKTKTYSKTNNRTNFSSDTPNVKLVKLG
jgi:hypothetical protein